MSDLICRHCGTINEYQVKKGEGPHHAQAICTACNKHIKWLPAPAKDMIMPFGKYAGSMISEITDDKYLLWVVQNVKPGPVTRSAKLALTQRGIGV
jgi:hypothetical protein